MRNIILNQEEALQLFEASKEKIVQVYSGRQGCACGCRGIHRKPTDRSFQSMLKRFKKMLEIGTIEYSPDVFCGQTYISIDLDDRVMVVYIGE